MIYIERKQPEPACLASERKKAHGNYRCGDVLPFLQKDFLNKCYLCESKAPTSLNVEHFRPHRGDKDLMYSWSNLFLACPHCNNTKLANPEYDEIIDCTDKDARIEERVRLEMKPYPLENVRVFVTEGDDPQARATARLLENIYNGVHTPAKRLEGENLKRALLKEPRVFLDLLVAYYDEDEEPEDRDITLKDIRKHLRRSSAFAGFKRWIIRESEERTELFGQYLV